MQRKQTIRGAALAIAALAALTVTSAAPAGSAATIAIRHQMRGCHSWSFNSGPFKASLAVTVRAGTVLKFTNNDKANTFVKKEYRKGFEAEGL